MGFAVTNPSAYSLERPLDLDDARQAARVLAENRKVARQEFEAAVIRAAEAKREYRKGLAIAFVSAEGDTAAMREADAKQRAADLEKTRDVMEGMVKVAQEKLAEIDGERASFHRLLEWSSRIDPMAMEDRTPRQAA
jgi:hypothetical protein